MSGAKLRVPIALVLTASLVFAASSVGLASEAEPLFEQRLNGQEAIDAVGTRLDRVARLNGMRADELLTLLEGDPHAFIDPDGALLYADPAPTDPADDTPMALPGYAESEAFLLNSKPGSNRTIYLDFDGHTVTNTAWNGDNGVPNGFIAQPFDRDGNVDNWSSAELSMIIAVWAQMAEDYAPFDVNVTTQYPGEAAITRSGASDQVYGTRIAITSSPSTGFCGSCGGVAYIGAFSRTNNHATYQPAWCFSGSYGNSAKNLAECASHEVGHNVGLHHDGQGGSAYYSGHNTWGPIMGTAYNQPVSQWSKGEYYGATNTTQDDLTVMVSNGLPVRADDHGNTTGSASALGGLAEGFITSPFDTDYFRFVAATTGAATFYAKPTGSVPNLDLALTLYNSSGTQLAHADPIATRQSASVAGGLDASIQHTVSGGQVYFLRIGGTGHGTPLANPPTGYTSYGSLGPYSLTVTGVQSAQQADSVGVVDISTGQWYLRDAATGLTTSFFYGVPGDIPFMGDWNGDGIATPGLYRQSTGLVYLRNSNTTGSANHTFHFGIPGDIPIVGDFNGNGRDTVSVYRPSTGQVFISNSLPPNGGNPTADISYYFGIPGDKPFAGDFNGDGIDTVGLHRESTGLVYFRNTHTTGAAHAQFFYGIPGDHILAGQWKPGSTSDTVGIFRPSFGWFYLRFANTQGVANLEFPYGNSKLKPVYGYFGNLPGGSVSPPSN